MGRVRYLVAYDIREPKRLRAVHKVVVGYGSMLQYSVYICDLSLRELYALQEDLLAVLVTAEDSVAFVPLGEGYDSSMISFLGRRVRALPSGGPIIV